MKIIMSSCARYGEVRDQVVASIRARIPDSELFCFTTEEDGVTAEDGVKIVKRRDHGWAANTLYLLQHFNLRDDENVLLWMDDLLLLDAAPEPILAMLVADFERLGFLALSLYQPAAAKCVSSAYSHVGLYSTAGRRYPVSCMASLINVGFLKTLLVAGETAWDFEQRTSARLAPSQSARCMITNFGVFDIANLVVRGHLVGWRSRGLKLESLPAMGATARLRYRLKMLLHFTRMLQLDFFKRLLY